MAFLDAPFRLALGNGEPRYYPAHVPIKDRADPGLRFELAQGQPWRWSGKDGPIEVELVDVLAAATLETLSGIHRLSRSSATARRSGCGLARKPGRGSRPGQASPGEAV